MQTYNINLKTGIRYGIISANEIDTDFLSDFDAVYEEMHCSNCNEVLTDVYCSNCETENPDYEYQEASDISTYNKNGLVAEYDSNTNYVTVFKSRSIFKRTLCSPCYPNAGDLSSPGQYKTYGIPTKYLR